MLLCTNEANRLSGKSDDDVESVNNDEFFGCLFNQSEPKKDATKRKEGFLSAVPAKKIDDNSFADAALKKLFVQYNTSLLSSAAFKRFLSVLGTANLTLCLPWGPMDPKMKFDLTLLRTDGKHDFHVA